mmetsp:Transcript_17405/g.40668  ORF Transcript_17405/g.40668 Transcript_17405/m.40668 type:complete len:552 (+) Transcript_17405:298-1953(+)
MRDIQSSQHFAISMQAELSAHSTSLLLEYSSSPLEQQAPPCPSACATGRKRKLEGGPARITKYSRNVDAAAYACGKVPRRAVPLGNGTRRSQDGMSKTHARWRKSSPSWPRKHRRSSSCSGSVGGGGSGSASSASCPLPRASGLGLIGAKRGSRSHLPHAADLASLRSVAQAHVPGSASHADRCVEALLFQCLQRVDAQERKSILRTCFSQPQRLALEKWILQNKGLPKPAEGFGASPSDGFDSPGGRVEVTLPRQQAQQKAGGSPNFGVQTHAARGRLSYRAKVIAGPFHLVTSYCKTRLEVQDRVQVLLRIRQSVTDAMKFHMTGHCGSQSLTTMDKDGCVMPKTVNEETARDALAAAFQDALKQELGRVEHRSWHVRFYMTVAARAWVGKALATPSYDASNQEDLSRGLEAWQLLAAARGPVCPGLAAQDGAYLPRIWAKVRQAYIEIWMKAGRKSEKIEKQLQKMELRRATGSTRMIRNEIVSLKAVQLAKYRTGSKKQHREKPFKSVGGDTVTAERDHHTSTTAATLKIRCLLKKWVMPAQDAIPR